MKKLENKYELITAPIWENISIQFTKDYKGSKGTSDVSATQLIDSPLASELKRKYSSEVTLDVTDTVNMSSGTIMHKAMEMYSPEDWLVEYRFFKEVDGWVLSGQADFIVPTEKDELGIMTKCIIGDHKNTSMYKLKKEIVQLHDFSNQLNVLSYLIKNADWVEDSNGQPVTWTAPEVDGLVIAGRAKDFSLAKAMQNKFPSPLKDIWFDVWDDEKALAYVKERIALHQKARDQALEDINVIPQCTDLEMWANPDQYAVVKVGGKKAENGSKADTVKECEEFIKRVTKEAQKAVEEATCGQETKAYKKLVDLAKRKYVVETRPGSRTRCMFYCDYKEWCPYGDKADIDAAVNAGFKKLMDAKLKKEA